jgi:AraC-like DNA-binding protein
LFCDLIEKQYYTPITLEFIAAQCNMSVSYLPIGEVAEKCGFNDVSNFGRTFRKKFGMSPVQARKGDKE